MNTVYFIYSGNNEIDDEAVRGLKNWLPVDINIVKAKIMKDRLITLDEKMDDWMNDCLPFALQTVEKPVYITGNAYDTLKAYNFRDIKDIKRIAKIVYELKQSNDIVSGRAALQNFIDGLRKS